MSSFLMMVFQVFGNNPFNSGNSSANVNWACFIWFLRKNSNLLNKMVLLATLVTAERPRPIVRLMILFERFKTSLREETAIPNVSASDLVIPLNGLILRLCVLPNKQVYLLHVLHNESVLVPLVAF